MTPAGLQEPHLRLRRPVCCASARRSSKLAIFSPGQGLGRQFPQREHPMPPGSALAMMG